MVDSRRFFQTNEDELLRNYVIDIIRCVAEMHRAKFSHCDLKLHNILRTQDGEIRLCDFGLTQYHEYGTTEISTKGTYEYMAPEVFNPSMDGYCTKAADVYTLAIIIYEALEYARTFKSPHVRHPETNEVLWGSMDFQHLDCAQRDFLKRMTSTNASERPSADQVLEFFS